MGNKLVPIKETSRVKKLSEICSKSSSNLSFKKIKDDEGKFPIYGAKGLIKKISFHHQKQDYISLIKDGAGIGRVNLRPKNSSVIGTLQYIIPSEDIDLHYLYYFLLGMDFTKYSRGAAIPHIYFKDYSQEELLIPPLQTQKKIVAILDEAFEKISQAKECAEQNLKNSKEVFESYLQGVFKSGENGWEEKTLKEVCEKITDGSHNPPKGIDHSNYIMLSSKNVFNDSINDNSPRYLKKEDYESENKRTEVKVGDILLTIVGTIGRVAVVSNELEKFTLQRSVAVLKNNKEKIGSRFLMFLLQSIFEEINEKSRGVAQKGIYLSQIRNLSVFLPPIKEQKQIVQKLDEISDKTKKLEQIYTKKLEDLEELKQSILQKAFKGELTESLDE